MKIAIHDGWVLGSLAGIDGEPVPIRHFPQPPYVKRTRGVPDLVLHTTESDRLVTHLKHPSEWQVGDHVICQHKPITAKGEASRLQDDLAMQVEIVGHSQLTGWLPEEASLGPLVALVAFLHARGLIRTGIRRPVPNGVWPVEVDQLPAATTSYYRRRAGLWPRVAGVYGHIELPGDDHWDPGGFEYPRFFSLVRSVLSASYPAR